MRRSLVLFLFAVPLTGWAHYSWITPESLTPAPGSSVSLRVEFGHDPGSARPLAADRLANLRFIGADGASRPVAAEEVLAVADVGGVGTALVAGRQRSGFWTRTPEGGKRAPRSEVADATSCSRSSNGFKALLAVGDGAGGASTEALGHVLELVPQADVAALAPGAPLPLRLLFEGEALAGATVEALSLGGEGRKVTAVSDDHGEVALALDAGTWLLHAAHATPYEDPAVCDENSYHATLVLRRD